MDFRQMALRTYSAYAAERDKRGLRDHDVAVGTGIAPASISDWKNGKSTPKVDKFVRIADFFGISVSVLLEGIR